jgi:hypothetical protein
MALSEPIPPAETVGARFTLLLAEERKRRKAFARLEEEELVRHKARKARIEQQAHQDPVVLETRQLLLDKEDEEYKRAKVRRKKAFDEKEKEHTMSVRDQLLAPLQSAPVSVSLAFCRTHRQHHTDVFTSLSPQHPRKGK